MTIVFAILLFSILIFVHELGHFLAAKASKVQVNEFAIFMGPAIWKKQKGDTLYSIRCIPIGGYCAMEGEDSDTDNPHSFQKAAWWKRLIILLAGSGMNFITGLLLMCIVFMPMQKIALPVIDSFEAFSTVDGADRLQVGDEIVEVDGERIYVQSDFSTILSLNPGDYHDIVVLRDGKEVTLDNFFLERHEVTDDEGNTRQMLGMSFRVVDATFGMKLKQAWNQTIDTVRVVRLSLQMLLSGQVGLQDMGGPVMIVDQMTQVADASETWVDALLNLLYYGAFIAVNLAVMNLLPIPALDGGRVVGLLLTTIVEKIIRKKIDPKYEGYLHAAGMILLFILMGVILFKDIFAIVTR
jgi:regulator of sigma E protease